MIVSRWFRFVFVSLAAMIWSLAPCVSQAQSDVRLRAETRAFTRLPVEIWPCDATGDAGSQQAAEVVDILESDLYLSSLFTPFATKDTLSMPAPTTRPAIPALPRVIRVAVKPALSIHGDRATMGMRLLDLHSRRELARRQFTGCSRRLRRLVHTLADEIVKILTGEEGSARSRIVFTAETLKGKELFVIDYDGANLQQLTDTGSLNLNPAWDPDGSAIVYTSYANDNPDLWVYQLTTGKSEPLLQRHGLFASPAWSPDGRSLLFVSTRHGNAEIYVLLRNSGRVARLTHHPAIDASPSWSPTGRQIVFTSDRLGTPQIYIMGAEGTDVQHLPVPADYADSPAWSPRGDKIAYVARGPSGFDIFVYDIASEESMQLTMNQGSNEDPTWSPNGYRLAFTSTRDGGRDIYSMLWDGSGVERLTVKGTCTSPSWSSNRCPAGYLECAH